MNSPLVPHASPIPPVSPLFDALNPRIAGNIPGSSGSSPESAFWLAVRKVRPGTFPSAAGNGPEILLSEKRTFTKEEFSAPGQPPTHSFGRGPLSELLRRSSVCRLGAVASEEGIVPVSLLPRATKYLSDVTAAAAGFVAAAAAAAAGAAFGAEIDPESLLSATSSSRSAGAASRLAGIEPVNAFE